MHKRVSIAVMVVLLSWAGAVRAQPSQVDDRKIVLTVLELEHLLQKATTVGTRKSGAGPVREQSTQLDGALDNMIGSLERYALRRGFMGNVSNGRAAPTVEDPQFDEMMKALESLNKTDFEVAFLTIMHGFVGEMTGVLRGGAELATDPILKTMLQTMERDFLDHQLRIQTLMVPPANSKTTPKNGASPPRR